MTIEESTQRLIETRKQKGRFSVNECIALEMAIASLEAWEKVKAEIDAYLVVEEFGTAYRQDIRAIIDKHLQKVGDSQ